MNSQMKSGTVGFGTLLFLLFLALKLCGVINWSWWWVCAPLWIPLAISVGVLVGVLLGCLIVVLLE